MSLPTSRKLYPQVPTIFGETQGLCYDMCRLYIVFTWNTGRRKIARALIDTRVESLKKLKLVSSRFSSHSQRWKYWTNICYSHLLSMKKDRDAPIKRRAVVKCELKMAGHSFHVGPHLSPTLLPLTSQHQHQHQQKTPKNGFYPKKSPQMIFWVIIIWAKATFFFEQLFPVVAKTW